MASYDRTVAEHLAVILAEARPTPEVEVDPASAVGLVLAESVTAAVALPSFDNSAMDGYAVRRADLVESEPPTTLPVTDDIAAGAQPNGPLLPGAAARIMTGAPLPVGADAVVPVEDTDGGTARVRIDRIPSAGSHIRRLGEDAAAGSTVLTRGTTVTAPVVGLLAAVGRTAIRVHHRPRVLVVSTGAELVPPGEPLPPGSIHDSNGPMLAAELTRLGAEVIRTPIVPDLPGRLAAAVQSQLEDGIVDLVVTTAGVSAGAYDIVKQDLAGEVDFVRVAMQPGKPQGFGRIGADRIPVLTLPGNPVSAWVSAQVFLRPLLDALMGREPRGCPVVPGVLTTAVNSPAGREQYLRAVAGTGVPLPVEPLGGPGSHLLASLARADVLIVIPAASTELAAGSTVDVLVPELSTHHLTRPAD